MKKHIVLIMNILLVAAIIGGVIFTVMNIANRSQKEAPDAVEPASAPTSAASAAPTEPPERFKIGVVRHGLDKDSDSCYEGFTEQLKALKLFDRVDIEYVIENDDEECIAAIWRLVDEGCDMLYTIGPFASKYASTATLDIPIVFAAVADPEEMGLVVSNEAPGGNVTGVSSYTPCFEQIDLIPLLLPDAKSVAAIYSSTDESAVRQAIIGCKEAEVYGLTAQRYPVNDREGLREALADVKTKGIEVIYVPVDKMIGEHIADVVTFSQRNGIPVICGNRAMMDAGCLATCEINYHSVGSRAADLCYDILVDKKAPATLSVIYKYDCYNFVNSQTAEKLKLTLSDAAKAKVQLVE